MLTRLCEHFLMGMIMTRLALIPCAFSEFSKYTLCFIFNYVINI